MTSDAGERVIRSGAAPFFSIVMPLYDKAVYLDATLASIAAQTFDDYEVVVVDDGSHDDGPARVEAIGGRYWLIRQENAGPGVARNRGIAESRGTWIAFLDADDLWDAEHLATLARTIAACPEAGVVATGYARGDAPLPPGQRAVGSSRYVDFFREPGLIWTSATAVRADALRAESFGRVWPGEDVELWIRLALRHRVAVTTDRTAIYVQRTGGAMDSQTSTAGAVEISRQPVFLTIAAILADPTFSHRHDAVAAMRNTLLLDYTRPSLFNGQVALARAYLEILRAEGGQAPFLYRVLTRLPAPLVRAGSRTYGAAKRRLARRSRESSAA